MNAGAARAVLTIALLCAALLAGCSDGGDDTVTVTSVEARSAVEPEAPPAPPPKKGTGVGHIAGYVVDEAFKVQEGLVVRLPAFDLQDRTDRKGQFEFIDLPAGVYALQVNATGFLPVDSMIKVKEDEFTRLRVILKRIPPPEPFHRTVEFEGYAEVTGGLILGSWWCECVWELDVEQGGLHTIILEASMDGQSSLTGSPLDFSYYLEERGCCTTFASGRTGDPMRVELQVEGTQALRDSYGLRVYPYSRDAPQTAVRYEVFATLFYNGPPPEGWSITGA